MALPPAAIVRLGLALRLDRSCENSSHSHLRSQWLIYELLARLVVHCHGTVMHPFVCLGTCTLLARSCTK